MAVTSKKISTTLIKAKKRGVDLSSQTMKSREKRFWTTY
jgi:hypothetical protein